MKKKIILILVLVGIFVSGCSKISEDNNFIKGQEKLESHSYDEALNLLSLALDEDPKNESARAMYIQAIKMKTAQIYEENNDYEKAIKELDFIVNIDNGSKKIKRESINKKSELEKLQKEYEKEFLERKENAKKTAKEYINNVEPQIIYEINKEEEDKKEESEIEEETNENQPSNKPTTDTEENSKPDNNVEENTETSTEIQ